MSAPTLQLLAPAKINLYLHITGKRADGYHLLDSLCVFTTIADEISLRPADTFSLSVIGPFAPAIAGDAQESNLVTCAAHALAAHLGREAGVSIVLTKNIPPGGGLGGGSSDAAATIKGLLQLWDASIEPEALHALLLSLGSDVPACYAARPVIMRGVGDELHTAPAMPGTLPMVVIFPGMPSSTIEAYKNFKGPFTPPATPPANLADRQALIEFLSAQTNDLYAPAVQSVPVIEEALEILGDQDGLMLGRMSGSGSTCFGVFENGAQAERAVSEISRSCPHWWVRRGDLWSPH